MPKEKPLWKGSAFRLCLLSAALFLCLQLGLRRSWALEEKAGAAAVGALRARVAARKGGAETQAHLKPEAATAGRRRGTYLRSSRRSSSEQPPGSSRRKIIRWHVDLQPWASPTPSLNYEALRFLKYITTPQISCEHMNINGLTDNSESIKKPWSICLDDRFNLVHRMKSKQCRLYSLGLGSDDNQFEMSMANSGCEVHRFDPSIKSAHIQEGQHLWYHRLSIDWRDPNPAIAAHKLRSRTKKLGTILNEFGHQKIDVLKADMESAEWKILENLILENIVEQIGQLVFEVHVHWPGFETGAEGMKMGVDSHEDTSRRTPVTAQDVRLLWRGLWRRLSVLWKG
nr:methyltransferase-like protein 24 isoform X2 [Pelodiscus sinensis]XP_006123262.1 methyltransferase-like protein 24 isoform X2 [Pelodiscus sinensis]|eukprot:XP_006123261.1 methyltransferase-like protein 24 isoform X2 [Pelodiscus sinensis]